MMYLAGLEILVLGTSTVGNGDTRKGPKSNRGQRSFRMVVFTCVHFTSYLCLSVIKNVWLLPTSLCHNQFHQLFLSQTSAKKTLLENHWVKNKTQLLVLRLANFTTSQQTIHQMQLQMGLKHRHNELATHLEQQLRAWSWAGSSNWVLLAFYI